MHRRPGTVTHSAFEQRPILVGRIVQPGLSQGCHPACATRTEGGGVTSVEVKKMSGERDLMQA